MSKKSKTDGIKLIPDPPRKTVQWYLNVDKPNPRLPKNLNPLDIMEDKCGCDCEVLLEVSALDLHNFLIETTESVKRSQEASAIASLIQKKPVTIKTKTEGEIIGQKDIGENLSFIQLCKNRCPELNIDAVWERTQTMLIDSVVGQGLRDAYKLGVTDRQALGNLYNKLLVDAKQYIKRFETAKEALDKELKHMQAQPRGKKAI